MSLYNFGVQDAIIGLDIGTTNAKAAIFNLAGVELASSEAFYGLSAPQPGWAEQNPADVWHAVTRVLRAAIQAAGESLHTIALAVASQSGSLVPADRDGVPIYPSITWMDGRTESLVQEWMAEDFQSRVRAISGWNIHPGLPLATIAWLRRNNPALHAAVGRWLCMNDYIVHQLTGQFITNPSNAGVTQLMDAASATWSAELCEMAGAHPAQFSAIQPSGTSIGLVVSEVCRETGLSPDTLVINGGHDQSCTAMALGVLEPGQVLLASGTSWVVTGVVGGAIVSDIPAELDLNFHVVPNRWTISQSLGGLGASLEWLVRECWQETGDRDNRFAAMDTELASTSPGCSGLIFAPVAGGHAAPAGMQRGGFVNLQLGHTRAHMARAVLEGAAYELRLALERMQTDAMRIDSLWMVGGATRSTYWPAIVADITGYPLRVTQSSQLPAVGAAILAGAGAGVYATVNEAQQRIRQPEQSYLPDRSNRRCYNNHYAEYCRMVHLLA
ncbi:MAG: FGGY family carbohydrate kinase [Chloroflexi bacterium]|nr:FGGY family carbohydrate kinase [Chloroflexota bacterium]